MRGLLLPLVHHDPNAAAGATGIRAFLGEAWVHQVAVVMHTTGALVVAAALLGVLLLRSVPGSAVDGTAWTAGHRRGVRALLFAGWGINFLGGTMRLYEPDHPGLDHIGDLAWVQLLVAKHIALFAAIGLSVLAVGIGPVRWTRNLRAHAVVGLVLVLFASFAGGISSGLPLLASPSDTADDPQDHLLHGNESVVTWQNASIALTGTPLAPAAAEIPLSIPSLVTELVVEIRWQTAQVQVSGSLIDPSGQEVTATEGEATPTSAEMSIAGPVTPGTWHVRLSSMVAANEPVTVAARITEGGLGNRILEETVTVAGRGFEVNLFMDPGDAFNYSWSLAEGDTAVTWDIHSHPDATTVNEHVQGRDTGASGNFTAGPDGIYSMFWQPDTGQVVTLTYRIEGTFRVHSIFRGP